MAGPHGANEMSDSLRRYSFFEEISFKFGNYLILPILAILRASVSRGEQLF
jgi:hypothetical protein